MEKGKLTKQDSVDKAKGNPSKPAPYVEKGKLTKQDSVDKETKAKGKGKKAKADKEPVAPAENSEQLLDLNSSWDSTAQVSPGISSFAKDTNQILQPQALTTVLEEEGRGEESAKDVVQSRTPPKPKPRSRSVSLSPEPQDQPAAGKYSVARLSQLFDQGLSPVQAQGWSSTIEKPASPVSPAFSPVPPPVPPPLSSASISAQDDYVNLDRVVTSPVPAPRSTGPSPPHVSTTPTVEVKYEVIYDYQAKDPTEVTIVEGGVVTLVPREDASEGWVMVRVPEGKEGWVPQSYVQPLAADNSKPVQGDMGVAKETGQVMAPPEVTSPSSGCQCESLSPLCVP